MDSFDRFGDDLCEILLKYVKPNEKFKFETVSKQWKRCIHTKVESLAIGKNSYFPEVYQTNQSNMYEEMKKLAEKYPRLQRLHLDVPPQAFNRYKRYIEVFHHLKKIHISWISDNLMATDLVLPRNIEYVGLDFHVPIHNEQEMTDLVEDFADKASTLKICFEDCTYLMVNVMKFTKLRTLHIWNKCNEEFLLKLSKQLPNLKELDVDKIINGNEFEIINICRQFKALELFHSYVNKKIIEWHKYGYESTDDYRRIINNSKTIGCSDLMPTFNPFMIYVERQKICHLGRLDKIDFINNSFNFFNILILDHCSWTNDWIRNGFHEYLNKSSISTIILDEMHVHQKLIDVFVKKATQNTNQDYVISTYDNQQAKKFEILPNLTAFIRYGTIEDCVYTCDSDSDLENE